MEKNLHEKILEMESVRGSNHPLDQFRQWMKISFGLNLPGRKIHVAGTNGKGSVITWLQLLLQEAGYSTLSFTSPHLIRHMERISVNGVPVSEKEWEEIYDEWQLFFKETGMTMFEMDLWMAIVEAQKRNPDFWLMETGMGGTKDATTALHYDAAIITHIGLDHMAFLGTTYEEVARAKAGIMEKGVPCWIGEKREDCLQVFRNHAQSMQTPLHEADLTWPEELKWPAHLPVWQKDNFLLALQCVQGLNISLSPARLQKVLDTFFWAGRYQWLSEQPAILLDGAHNPDGVHALCQGIKEQNLFFDVCYFSCLADKQAREMIGQLKNICHQLILVHFDCYRLSDLQQLASQEQLEQISFEQMIENLHTDKQSAVICGSLYFAAGVLKAFQQETRH